MILQMISGAGAGAVAKTATAPLERIKIIFQVQVRVGRHVGVRCIVNLFVVNAAVGKPPLRRGGREGKRDMLGAGAKRREETRDAFCAIMRSTLHALTRFG